MYLWKSENVQERNNHAGNNKIKDSLCQSYLSSNIVDDICAAGKYLKVKNHLYIYKKTLLILKFFLSI